MKKTIFLTFCFFCMFFCGSLQAAFVEGLEDIPLADGLIQSEGSSLNFGNEETRLIEIYFTSKTTNFENVSVFYKNTLPQMGWHIKRLQEDKLFFEREGESLEMSQESKDPFVVRLTVKSKN